MRDFIARHPFALGPAETSRLIAAVGAMGDGASIDDVRVAVATAYGGRLSDAILRTTAENLARRIASVRRRHVAATNFRDMLSGAQLPSEGVLADEVRGATLDAMGPIVGIPVAADSPAAYRLDMVPVGGAPNDRALSLRWRRALAAGAVAAAGLLGDPAGAGGRAVGRCCRCCSRSRPRPRRSRRPRCWASRWACRRCRSMGARWRLGRSSRWRSRSRGGATGSVDGGRA